MPSIGWRKNPSQTRVHSFSGAIECRGVGCKIVFQPIRKDQGFCSRTCRVKYFSLARSLGSILLERARREKRYQNIVNGFLFQIRVNDRNLPPHERARLALLLKPAIEKKAEEKQKKEGRELGGKATLPQKSAKGSIDTRQEIAKVAGVSHDTIHKSEIKEYPYPRPSL